LKGRGVGIGRKGALVTREELTGQKEERIAGMDLGCGKADGDSGVAC